LIVGTGIDLIDIRRIKKTLDKFGIRFIKRVFTDYEIKRSENKLKKTESYAKRFAAKEACSKALGTGFRRGVYWSDIGVINKNTGQPSIKLTGGAKKRLDALIPENHYANISVSISDDFPWAQANVIIEAIRIS
jgi:holo-[acyl-carrier protein] synthase